METIQKDSIGKIIANDHQYTLFFDKNRVVNTYHQDMTAIAKYTLRNKWNGDYYDYETKPIPKKDEHGNTKYICEYHSISMDELEIMVYGFGKTEHEAEKNCQDNLHKIKNMKI